MVQAATQRTSSEESESLPPASSAAPADPAACPLRAVHHSSQTTNSSSKGIVRKTHTLRRRQRRSHPGRRWHLRTRSTVRVRSFYTQESSNCQSRMWLKRAMTKRAHNHRQSRSSVGYPHRCRPNPSLSAQFRWNPVQVVKFHKHRIRQQHSFVRHAAEKRKQMCVPPFSIQRPTQRSDGAKHSIQFDTNFQPRIPAN